MKPRTALLIAGAATCYTVGALASPAWAHTSSAGFTSATCLPSGAWSATLNISATDAAKHPVADIKNPQAPLVGAPVPFSHAFVVMNETQSFTVSVVVRWDDGVTNNLGSFTAQKPNDCSIPTTTTTTPEVTTSPTTTSPSTVPPSTSPPPSPAPPATSVSGPPSSPSSSAASSTRLTQPTGQTPINLPATGTDPIWPFGAVAVIAGVILVLFTRWRGARP